MNLTFSSICVALTLVTMMVSAEDPVVAKRLAEMKQKFEAMPAEERDKYLKFKQKAYEDFKMKKYHTCMVAVSDARRIFRGDFDLIYILAACREQLRDFKAATDYYNQVLEINPEHISSLVRIIDITLIEGRFEEATKKIKQLNALIESRSLKGSSLLDFKYLICLTKLSGVNPRKHDEDLKKMQELYTYMHDDLYYYYAQALKELSAGNKEEGLAWIMKGYLIFRNPSLMEDWNQALTNAGYLDTNEVTVISKGHN